MARYNPDNPRAIRGKQFEKLTMSRLQAHLPVFGTEFLQKTRDDWLPSIHPGIEKRQLDYLESMWGDITVKRNEKQVWIECCSVKYNPTRISKRKIKNFSEQYGHDLKWYAFKWEDDDDIHYIPSTAFNAWIKKAGSQDDMFYTFTKNKFLTIRKRIVGTQRFVEDVLIKQIK